MSSASGAESSRWRICMAVKVLGSWLLIHRAAAGDQPYRYRINWFQRVHNKFEDFVGGFPSVDDSKKLTKITYREVQYGGGCSRILYVIGTSHHPSPLNPAKMTYLTG